MPHCKGHNQHGAPCGNKVAHGQYCHCHQKVRQIGGDLYTIRAENYNDIVKLLFGLARMIRKSGSYAGEDPEIGAELLHIADRLDETGNALLNVPEQDWNQVMQVVEPIVDELYGRPVIPRQPMLRRIRDKLQQGVQRW